MKVKHGLLVAVMAMALLPAVSAVGAPPESAALASAGDPTCSDYPNQAAAQEAADTRDADGDGVHCVIYSG